VLYSINYKTYRKGLLDVRRDEVIVAVLASRALRLGSLRREFGHALHCRDIVALLCGRKGSPVSVSFCILLSDELIEPFPSDNNVQWIASLPLVSFLSSLVDLLIEAGDASIKIGG
jgi:hypothetical protein